MVLVVCPGIHPVQLTADLLRAIGRSPPDCFVFPSEQMPPYSPHHHRHFLQAQLAAVSHSNPLAVALVFVTFSAGTVGALGAARWWQRQGGRIAAFIAFDGWGVPLHESFPVHRFSHDYFTHWSSGLLGQGASNFYADPAVEHWQLWRSPHQVSGYWVSTASRTPPQACTAAEALIALLAHYDPESSLPSASNPCSA
jgi:hypothetical protein